MGATEARPAAMDAMAQELKVNTLEGSVLTVQVTERNTIKDLKAMLSERKPCENLRKVTVLAEGALVDDDQTVEAAGLLHAESEVL